MNNNYDKLHTKAPAFYASAWAERESKDQRAKRLSLDEAGRTLYLKAAQADYKHQAKTASYLRRVASDSYLRRSEDGEKLFMSSFDQIGFRYEDVLDTGWYTDEYCQDTINGVVLAVGRHAGSDRQGDWRESEGLFMAGTKHSEWDGVTLYTDTFTSYEDAKAYAHCCAEREAEACREENEKYQREQQIETLKGDIVVARRKCLALLRDMRPLRKGLIGFPESVCGAIRDQVQGYLEEIRGYRNELGELA